MKKKNNKVIALVTMGLMAAPLAAQATLLTWDFSVLIETGPGIGSTLDGHVSVDNSGLLVGPPGISETGLISELSFTFDGVAYDETTANTGFLQFNFDGSLFALSFGNGCGPGFCGAGSPGSWFLVIGSARVPTDEWDFSGATSTGQQVLGDMTFSLRQSPPTGEVPEPGTLALLGLGLAGLGFARRRKNA